MIERGGNNYRLSDFVVAKAITRNMSIPSAVLQRPLSLAEVYKSLNKEFEENKAKSRNLKRSFSIALKLSSNQDSNLGFTSPEEANKHLLLTAIQKVQFTMSNEEKLALKAKKTQLMPIKKADRKGQQTSSNNIGLRIPLAAINRQKSDTNIKRKAPLIPLPSMVNPHLTMRSLIGDSLTTSNLASSPYKSKTCLRHELTDAGKVSSFGRPEPSDNKESKIHLSNLEMLPGSIMEHEQTYESSKKCDLTVNKYFQQRIFGGDPLAMARHKRFQLMKLEQAETLQDCIQKRKNIQRKSKTGYLIERKFFDTQGLINEELEKIKIQKLVANQVFHDLQQATINY